MRMALWPATGGYFLETLMEPSFGDADIAVVRDHFVDLRPRPWARCRRFGSDSQPYGILPVTSLRRWKPDRSDDPRHAAIVRLLRMLAPEWLARTEAAAPIGVPRVGRRGSTPDAELLAIFGRDALSLSYRVRAVCGPAVGGEPPRTSSTGLDPAGRDRSSMRPLSARRPAGTQGPAARQSSSIPRTKTIVQARS